MPLATPSPRVALVLSAGFCSLLLAPLCFGEHNDDASLKSLYDGRRWGQWIDLELVAGSYLPKGSMTNETVQSHMSDRPCALYAGNSERSQSQQSFGMLLPSSVMRAQVWESGEQIPVRPCRKSPPPRQIWLDLSCTSSFCQSPQLTGAL
jgi:hypothetical protein